MRTAIVALLLSIPVSILAQKWEKSINANYNWTYLAQSVEGSVNFRHSRHVLAAGIQVYLNQYADFHEGAYKNAGHAEHWYERVGLNASYRSNIWKDIRIVNPYLFYQLQVAHLSFREPVYDTVNQFYGQIGAISNPHWIAENFIGIGFVFQLHNNLNVFQEAGIGMAYWGNNPKYARKLQWEWDYTLKLGLLYRFNGRRQNLNNLSS